MIASYYPGCTLKTTARLLDQQTREAAAILGVTLEELPEWQCCGAVYPQAKNENGTKLSAARALKQAADLGQPLVTVCSACHHVLKRVNHDLMTDAAAAARIGRYLEWEKPYRGETQIIHLLELIRDYVGFDTLKEKVQKPLAGKKVGAYYGCLLLRPNAVMQMDDAEDPTIMEDMLRALGAEPVYSPMRNECCGSHQTLTAPSATVKNSGRVLESFKNNGAELVITACPLCMYNLSRNRTEDQPPVIYFTELLAEALRGEE